MSAYNSINLLRDYHFHICKLDQQVRKMKKLHEYKLKVLDPAISRRSRPTHPQDNFTQRFINSTSDFLSEMKTASNNGNLRVTLLKRKAPIPIYIVSAELAANFANFMYLGVPIDADNPGEKKLRLRLYGKIMVKSEQKRKTYHQSSFNASFDLKDIVERSGRDKPQRYIKILDNSITRRAMQTSWSSKMLKVVINAVIEWPKDEAVVPIQINLQSFMHQLYSNEATKDFKLVAQNGAEVKCHKIILSVHSKAFAEMLSNGGLADRLDLDFLSELGLKCFVGYLYGFEISTFELQCELAFELLKAAHAFQIQQLINQISIMMEKKKNMDWFKDGIVFELYFFARSIDALKKLEEAVFQVIKIKHLDIQSCAQFKKLTSETALDLVWKLHDLHLNV